jgi:hypothetical protein
MHAEIHIGQIKLKMQIGTTDGQTRLMVNLDFFLTP